MSSPSYLKQVRKICGSLVKESMYSRGIPIPLFEESLETPPDEKLGDLAFPCFTLAKKLKNTPVQIAQEVADAIKKLPSEIERVEATGPYVNFFLKPTSLVAMLFKSNDRKKSKELIKNKETKKNKEINLIEYISPNTNKPLHLGHVRNGVLGDALARIAEYTGSRVIRTLLINDRGIHICKSMVAYQYQWKVESGKWKEAPTPKSAGIKGDHFVGNYYALYEKFLKEDQTIEDRARACLQQWEAGNKKTHALWKKMNAWTLTGMKATMKRLRFSFDKTYFESDIYTSGRDIILNGLKKGIFKQDETGAVYADLEAFGLPNKILLRRDGTTLYITQDIFLAYQKWKDFMPTSCIYVVGSEQDLYLKQLFAVLKLLHVPFADHLMHISYGMVRLPEGKMKSREGTVVDADDLIDELVALARAEILKRENSLAPPLIKHRSESIALAALKYYLLIVAPSSNMVFHPKESIALQGKTGPYLLYAYARLRSIERKAKSSQLKAESLKLKQYDFAEEKSLLLTLAYFQEVIEKSATTFNPSLLAHFLYDLAKKTNDYYHSTRVLDAPEPARTARLLLIARIADTLKTGLGLLGIKTIEKM